MFTQWTETSTPMDRLYLVHAVAVALIGATMNVFVIYRMRRLHRRNPEQYRNGIGICLFVMSVADLISLGSLFAHFASAALPVSVGLKVHEFLCKIIAFASHTAYTQSMWCWWLMSALRFMAARRPLQYTTLWRIPFFAMSATFLFAALLNSWLLASVGFEGDRCAQTMSAATRLYRAADVLLSFVAPTILVLYMDLSVLCCRIESPLADPMLQIVINRPNAEKRKSLNRFLVITASCVVLNMPENFLRFGAAIGLRFAQPDSLLPAFALLSKAMFFTQFAFKSFYLTTFVYDRSVLSKTNSSRQLSLSFRQRLEESSHLIRERASTISYRATTPIPPIHRGSSCAALDQLMPGKYSL